MAGAKKWWTSKHTEAVNKLISQRLITVDSTNWVEEVAKSTDPDILPLKDMPVDKLTSSIKRIFNGGGGNFTFYTLSI